MKFQIYCDKDCTYNETLAVSGAGSFFFHYLDPYLYVTDEGTSSNSVLKIYDMSDPRGPVLASTTSLPNGSGAVHPRCKGNLLFIPYRNSKKLGIWDVSDRTNPTMLSETAVAFAPNGVAIIGSLAAVCFNENFLQTKIAEAWDVSNPSSPSLAHSYNGSKLGYTIRASHGNFFITGQNSSGGPQYLSALDGSSFSLLDTTATAVAPSGTGAGRMLEINAAGTLAFSAGSNGDGSIYTWDLSNLSNLTYVASTPAIGQTTCGAYKEDVDRLYIGGTAGISILDTSNPSAITLAGSISTSGESVTDAACIDDGCAGFVWGQGTGAAIHLRGTPPIS